MDLENNRCISCDPYMIASEDQMECVTPTCSDNEIIEVDGTCNPCRAYKTPSENKDRCIVPTCADNEIVNHDG